MEQAIIAFRAEVTRIEPRFKLGQDEPLETLREILAAHPEPELVRWMRRANRKRL
jgi:transcriptional regulator